MKGEGRGPFHQGAAYLARPYVEPADVAGEGGPAAGVARVRVVGVRGRDDVLGLGLGIGREPGAWADTVGIRERATKYGGMPGFSRTGHGILSEGFVVAVPMKPRPWNRPRTGFLGRHRGNMRARQETGDGFSRMGHGILSGGEVAMVMMVMLSLRYDKYKLEVNTRYTC